jgi:signal transduction histidine kinase
MDALATGRGDILIVDDTPTNLRLLSQMLTERGYKVRAVLNGARALAAALAAPPDLILLDVMMPEMNGYEVCRCLKADTRTQSIPILFISALGETEDKIKAFTSGGLDYITKPFQSEEVLARVQTHLALRNLRRQLEAANADLARQVQELEARNQELDAFAHTVAHDIKNPVSVNLGFAETLLEYYQRMSEADLRDSLQTIARNEYRVMRIVEELLLLSGVRKLQVDREPLDMRQIVRESLQRLAPTLKEYQAEVILPEAWPAALGHAPWVEEVWVNYISNGCKYGGRPPRLELGATLSSTFPPQAAPPFASPLPAAPPRSPPLAGGTEGGLVRFWVRDNGDGVPQEAQSRLFTPFTRLDQARATGHGLGLSIVRRIVEKLGGQVGMESTGIPGQGSLFYFALPTAPPQRLADSLITERFRNDQACSTLSG